MIENLSIETVIIVACVCGSVVLILSVVLIVLCCQRHRTKDQYEKTDTNILEPPAEAGKQSSSDVAASLRTPDAAAIEAPSTAPSHHPQQQPHLQHLVEEDCSTRDPATVSQVSLKDFNNVRFSYRASNPALANYPSLDRGTTNPSSSHPMTSMTSAADADDKRPRKVIYEVIV